MSKVALTCPVEDCTLPVDIIVKSSDGELLGAHKQNLQINTKAFPIVVEPCLEPLKETAEVLRLVLKYTHCNTRQPILDNISFTSLASLAEAVEKYGLYSATEICRMQMMNAIAAHPAEVFFYSAKYNYLSLADSAAKKTLGNHASHFVGQIRAAGLNDDIAIQWLCYRDSWTELLVQLSTFVPEYTNGSHMNSIMRTTCFAWETFRARVCRSVRDTERTMNRFSDILDEHKRDLNGCHTCLANRNKWQDQVDQKIAKLPKYSEFQIGCQDQVNQKITELLEYSEFEFSYY